MCDGRRAGPDSDAGGVGSAQSRALCPPAGRAVRDVGCCDEVPTLSTHNPVALPVCSALDGPFLGTRVQSAHHEPPQYPCRRLARLPQVQRQAPNAPGRRRPYLWRSCDARSPRRYFGCGLAVACGRHRLRAGVPGLGTGATQVQDALLQALDSGAQVGP